MIKKCIICENYFEATRITAKTCSKKCCSSWDYQKNKETYLIRAKKHRPKQNARRRLANAHKWFSKCKHCGIDFKKKCQSQIYCSIKCQRAFLYKKNTKNGKEKIWNHRSYNNQKDKWIKNNTKYQKKRRKEDPIYCMISRLRARTNAIFRKNDWFKKNKTLDLLQCTPIELKEHFEKQFNKGMTWKNRGKWHIDHIKPLSLAKTENELIKLCHYTNLQPLWAEDNLIKGNTYK